MGDDVDILLNLITGIIFLSTSPVWGTTADQQDTQAKET